MDFRSFVNESPLKMKTNSTIVKELSDDKNWHEYSEAISDFFEAGAWKKDYTTVNYQIMNLIMTDSSWESDYNFDQKKTTWSRVDKKLRAVLKKLNKEYIIDKGKLYNELKKELDNDTELFDYIAGKILKEYKRGNIKVSYPEFKYILDVDNWMKDFTFMRTLKSAASKDVLGLLITDGIFGITIKEGKGGEHISVSNRTSANTSAYDVEILTYSDKKSIKFTVSKTSVNRI